jgi:hypothetical protein
MDYLLGLFSSSTIFQVRARWITVAAASRTIHEKHKFCNMHQLKSDVSACISSKVTAASSEITAHKSFGAKRNACVL